MEIKTSHWELFIDSPNILRWQFCVCVNRSSVEVWLDWHFYSAHNRTLVLEEFSPSSNREEQSGVHVHTNKGQQTEHYNGVSSRHSIHWSLVRLENCTPILTLAHHSTSDTWCWQNIHLLTYQCRDGVICLLHLSVFLELSLALTPHCKQHICFNQSGELVQSSAVALR